VALAEIFRKFDSAGYHPMQFFAATLAWLSGSLCSSS
jgi:hypothetical protein